MDEELENAIQNVDLEGDEILNLLNKNLPPKINKIFDEIINEKGRKIIREKTGFDFDPYLRKYPIEIDDSEIQRIQLEQSSKKENDILTLKSAAVELNSIKEQAIKEVEDVIKFDYEFSLGSFAYEYDLNAPEFGDEINLKRSTASGIGP